MRRSDDARAQRRAGNAGSSRLSRATTIFVAVAALMLLTTQCAAAGGTAEIDSQKAFAPQGRTTIGFWAGEAVPGTDWSAPETYWYRRDTHAYTPYLWKVLRRYRIPLYFNLRYKRDFGPVPAGEPQRYDALRIIRTANRLGVPVWGWILVPYSDGYWAWEGAATEHFDATRSLAHWVHEKRLRLRGFVLDPEPRVRTPYETTAAILGGGNDAVFPALFQQAIDPAGQCAAWRGYARIPRWAERHHIRVATAPAPSALDDLSDRRLALQDASGFIVPNAPWSQLFFQAYRSVFAYYAGHDPGPSVVSSYLRSAEREFGDAGQISLGSAGRGPYRRFSRLIDDVRLAATLGARTLPIYSLERTLRAYGGPDALVRLVKAAQRPFAASKATESSVPSPQAKALRAAIRHADKAATVNTPAITAGRGAPLPPNRWPSGCGG